jgi:hypothetical protein
MIFKEPFTARFKTLFWQIWSEKNNENSAGCPEHKQKRYTHYAGFDLVTYLTMSHKEKASQPDTAPQNMLHLLSLCGNGVFRSTASSPAVKDSPMICTFNVVPYDRLRNKITDWHTCRFYKQSFQQKQLSYWIIKKIQNTYDLLFQKNRHFNQNRYLKCKRRDKIKILLGRK